MVVRYAIEADQSTGKYEVTERLDYISGSGNGDNDVRRTVHVVTIKGNSDANLNGGRGGTLRISWMAVTL